MEDLLDDISLENAEERISGFINQRSEKCLDYIRSYRLDPNDPDTFKTAMLQTRSPNSNISDISEQKQLICYLIDEYENNFALFKTSISNLVTMKKNQLKQTIKDSKKFIYMNDDVKKNHMKEIQTKIEAIRLSFDNSVGGFVKIYVDSTNSLKQICVDRSKCITINNQQLIIVCEQIIKRISENMVEELKASYITQMNEFYSDITSSFDMVAESHSLTVVSKERKQCYVM